MPRRISEPGPRRGRLAGSLVVVLLLSAILVAPVRSSVTAPIPSDPPPAPPPIPEMPAAGAVAPPSVLISDPITPQATCGPWAIQTRYGLWPTAQSWWEFSCTHAVGPCVGPGMCNQDLHSNDHTTYIDRFVYSGSVAVFYGELFSWFAFFDFDGAYGCDLWWDEPTTQWYVIGGITCPGDPVETPAPTEAPDPTATPAPTATSAPTATPAPIPTPTPVPNRPPVAVLRYDCVALRCLYDGGTSFDPDGPSVAFRWTFGDGTLDAGREGIHPYPAFATYALRLEVVDGVGATGAASASVSLIGVTATPRRVRGSTRVELSWTGATGASFAVSRDGLPVATVPGTTYTDILPRGPGGTLSYTVCQEGAPVCSAATTVTVP